MFVYRKAKMRRTQPMTPMRAAAFNASFRPARSTNAILPLTPPNRKPKNSVFIKYSDNIPTDCRNCCRIVEIANRQYHISLVYLIYDPPIAKELMIKLQNMSKVCRSGFLWPIKE